MCVRKRVRTLPQYRRHILRRHPDVIGATIWTGPVKIYSAPSGTSHRAGGQWTFLGTADGITHRGLHASSLVIDEPVIRPGANRSITMEVRRRGQGH